MPILGTAAKDAPCALHGLSVVIPVYRSETILPELVRRLEPVLREAAENFELVLVNDCSPDRSWDVISDLTLQYSWICPINLMRNYGQHNALLCGIRSAGTWLLASTQRAMRGTQME